MSARESINPNQLRLFYTAKELQEALTTSGDLQGLEDMDNLWERKLEQAKQPPVMGHGAGLYRSIRTKGWQQPKKPFTMLHSKGGHSRLKEGHHRVAVLADMENRTGRSPFLYVNHEDDEHYYY